MFQAKPAEGVLDNIVIPSSRNNELFLNPAFRKDESPEFQYYSFVRLDSEHVFSLA